MITQAFYRTFGNHVFFNNGKLALALSRFTLKCFFLKYKRVGKPFNSNFSILSIINVYVIFFQHKLFWNKALAWFFWNISLCSNWNTYSGGFIWLRVSNFSFCETESYSWLFTLIFKSAQQSGSQRNTSLCRPLSWQFPALNGPVSPAIPGKVVVTAKNGAWLNR